MKNTTEKTKILIVVDYQNDFANPEGNLYVSNADKIAYNIQDKIDSKDYKNIIYTFDTHTKTQYEGSDEQKIFPNIHCEYRENGWKLFNISPRHEKQFNEYVKMNSLPFVMTQVEEEYFFTKDKFDIWAGNPFYTQWFIDNFDPKTTEIEVVGVATNYCVFMNVMGLIKNKYKVTILKDCVEGIKSFPNGEIDNSYEENIQIMKNKKVKFKG